MQIPNRKFLIICIIFTVVFDLYENSYIPLPFFDRIYFIYDLFAHSHGGDRSDSHKKTR